MKEANEELSTKANAASWGLWAAYPGIGLFLASFISLFLELLLIRWVPSLIPVVAYYSNLMLLSSFLGLGCGTLVVHRRLELNRWFAPLLLLLMVIVIAIKGVDFRQGPDELRFLIEAASITTTLPTVSIFVLNALVFVPLGDWIGGYFTRLPPLHAYSWDLGGAIAGTAIFGVFSFFWFSPVIGFAVVMVFYMTYSCRETPHLLMTGLTFAVCLALILFSTDRTGIWSPYNFLRVKEVMSDGTLKPVAVPAKDIASRKDPPFYTVEVNNNFYMSVLAMDGRRYSKPSDRLLDFAEQYWLPHFVFPGAREVLVVGSGGGPDVEAALLAGAKHVDAVEIDPVIIRIGHQYNGSQPYKNPLVSLHNTDARAFFRQTNRTYDMIVFGFLDSQSLFSQMSNIRLDSYVYTRESFREAFSLLRQGGVLNVSFFAREFWMLDRLATMIRVATKATPLIYADQDGNIVIIAANGSSPQGPRRFMNYRRIHWTPFGTPEATDDWPYLYLRRRFIPLDYLVTIGALLAISLLFVFFSSGKERKGVNFHFFFLGAGFLLLETKSITTISLYFGTTWLVSMIVILGVLIMVLLANIVASKLRQFSLLLYLPLIVSVCFLYFFPTQAVSGWSLPSRLVYSLVVIPLPIFFAGLIFSTTFRESRDAAFAFGSNLLGAMVGGFVEYLAMITGTKVLLLVVLAFYLASLFMRLRGLRALSARAQTW